MKTVVVGSQSYTLDPKHLIGSGGEAEIYDIGNNQVFKLFKEPSHPDFVGDPDGQRGARARIDEHQSKLPAFLKLKLPSNVLGPIALGSHRNRLVGYSMKQITFPNPLLKYGERGFRDQNMNTVSDAQVTARMKELRDTVQDLHTNNIVIGDFNDLNILVHGAYLTVVDADSMQFDNFYAKMFTERFVDPLLCKPDELTLVKPHNADSDWYAFAVMLMQVNLFVHPYGGIYKPADPKQRVPASLRPLKRISVFHTDVCFPKPARALDCLPLDLAHYLFEIFEKDKRGEFPSKVLDIHWATCPACGFLHARASCPNCSKPHPTVKQTVEIRGKVHATTIFYTPGNILYACVQNGLKWVYEHNNRLNREGSIWTGLTFVKLNKIDVLDNLTFVGAQNNLIQSDAQASRVLTAVDMYRDKSCFDANETDLYFLQGGELYQYSFNTNKAHRRIGQVLTNQTQFWVGKTFGFGFYQAGALCNAFTFDAQIGGLKDISLPRIPGQIISSTCKFSETFAYFQLKTQYKGKISFHIFVIHRAQGLLSHQEDDAPDSWMAAIPNSYAIGNFLYLPTDEGLIRVDLDVTTKTLSKTRDFPDTEPWVSSASKILVAKDGLYTINNDSITKLTLN